MGRKKTAHLGREALVKEIQDKKNSKTSVRKSPHSQSSNVGFEKCPLTSAMDKLSIDVDECPTAESSLSSSPDIRDMCIAFLAIQEVLIRIPSYAHPAVSDYIKFQLQSVLKLPEVSNRDLQKSAPYINRQEIQRKITEASNQLGISLESFLMPPVYKCKLVCYLNHYLKIIFQF